MPSTALANTAHRATSSAVTSPVRASTSPALVAALLRLPGWVVDANLAPDGDVVLSSRARLARNVAPYAFPIQASDADLRRVAQEVRRVALADTSRLGELTSVEVGTLSHRERAELVGTRRISPDLAAGAPHRYALLDDAGELSVFINEEDHVRVQAVEAGNAPLLALNSCEDAERRLAQRLHFARSEPWGYLTCALSNMGTGLRVSSLLHLPALRFTHRLSETLQAAQRLGISVRGAQGEHSRALGDLYQVSNAVTLGLTPSQIAGRVRPVVDYLVASERAARAHVAGMPEILSAASGVARACVEDAARLSAPEALDLLSTLRLAHATGIEPSTLMPSDFARLVLEMQAGSAVGADPAPDSLRDDIRRSARLRTALRAQ